MKAIFHKYIIHPTKLLFANSSVFLAFFAVIVANYLSNNDSVPLSNTGRWAFEIIPRAAIGFLTDWRLWLIVLSGFLLKTWLTALVGKEMLFIYQHNRVGLWNTIKRITIADLGWFVKCELVTYTIFGSIALLFYLPGYFLFHYASVDLSWALLAAFGILYPCFYIFLSTGSMVAVMSISSKEKWRLLRFLLTGRRLFALYCFYFVRISLELGLIFVLPFVALAIFKNWWLATISSLGGLVLPFALMRGSAYELKLNLLRNDGVIRAQFRQHYAEPHSDSTQWLAQAVS